MEKTQLEVTKETHPHLEWDDAKAAHEYRLMQARELLASIGWVETSPGLFQAPKGKGEKGS